MLIKLKREINSNATIMAKDISVPVSITVRSFRQKINKESGFEKWYINRSTSTIIANNGRTHILLKYTWSIL